MAKSKTRTRTTLNPAEQEFVRNHVRENIDSIYDAIPDVDKKYIKKYVNDLIRNTGLIKFDPKEKKPGPVDKLMGKNKTFGAVAGTLAASEMADERRPVTVKSAKEIAKMRKDEIFVMNPNSKVR